jgi:hypothetical protein
MVIKTNCIISKQIQNLIFAFVLISISIFYNYHELIFERPQSVHAWRQADCASMALNYHTGKLGFFNPETHNLTSDEGTSGKVATSEIPVFYYLIAKLYSIFGQHEFIYRLMNTLIFLTGLFYLFILANLLLKDSFWAAFIPLLFFTSPVLVYYGNNYLLNSSALAFSFIGWFYFTRFIQYRKYKQFLISIIFFLLAGAFKVTALLSVFAILGLMFLEIFGICKTNKDNALFKRRPFQFILPVFAIFIVVGAWILYANYYNTKHDTTYFSTTIFPVWRLSTEAINKVLINVKDIWLDQYFHKSIFVFISICFIMVIALLKRGSRLFNLSILFISIQVILYVLLQFWTFRDHDYYTIELFILPVLIVLSFALSLKRTFPKLFFSYYFKAALLIMLAFNISYAREQQNARYNSKMNEYYFENDIYSITPFLREIGISENDTVISVPDIGHVSLYLMNQKGWTNYTDMRFNKGKPIRYNQSAEGIIKSIENGASFLIINRLQELYLKPYLQEFCFNLKGNKNNVYVFDLRDSIKNFNLPSLSLLETYYCDAEERCENGEFFVSDYTEFGNGITQSADFSYSGKFSSKIHGQCPYGFTIKIDNVKKGEKFIATAYIFPSESKSASIIASSSNTSVFYHNKSEIINDEDNSWLQLRKEFFVSDELPNNELVFYVHNPGAEPVYIDNFKIKRYKSILD